MLGVWKLWRHCIDWTHWQWVMECYLSGYSSIVITGHCNRFNNSKWTTFLWSRSVEHRGLKWEIYGSDWDDQFDEVLTIVKPNLDSSRSFLHLKGHSRAHFSYSSHLQLLRLTLCFVGTLQYTWNCIEIFSSLSIEIFSSLRDKIILLLVSRVQQGVKLHDTSLRIWTLLPTTWSSMKQTKLISTLFTMQIMISSSQLHLHHVSTLVADCLLLWIYSCL